MRDQGTAGVDVNALQILDFTKKMLTTPRSALLDPSSSYSRASAKTVFQDDKLVMLKPNQFGTTYDVEEGCYGYLPENYGVNLALWSEGDVDSFDGASAVTDAPGFNGFSASIGFGDNATFRFIYRAVDGIWGTEVAGVKGHWSSFFFRMDDGAAPVVGGNETTGDFVIMVDSVIVPIEKIVTQKICEGLYRVIAYTEREASGTLIVEILKYPAQSSRSFRVTGMHVNNLAQGSLEGSLVSSYIPTTTAAVDVAKDTWVLPTSAIFADPSLTVSEGTLLVDSRATSDSFLADNGFYLLLAFNESNSYNLAGFFSDKDLGLYALGVEQTEPTIVYAPLVAPSVMRNRVALAASPTGYLAAVNGSAVDVTSLNAVPFPLTDSVIISNESPSPNHFIYTLGFAPVALGQTSLDEVSI
jgi:hypothetical protein